MGKNWVVSGPGSDWLWPTPRKAGSINTEFPLPNQCQHCQLRKVLVESLFWFVRPVPWPALIPLESGDSVALLNL